MIFDKVTESFVILQEECAEVSQIVCKIQRFGIDSNRNKLIQEIGDVVCMIRILQKLQVFDQEELENAVRNKENKLKQWSKLYDENS